MMNRAISSRCLTALVAILILAGCGDPPGIGVGTGLPAANDVLRRGNGGDPQSLDPATAEDVHAFNVLADLYEGLVVEDRRGAISPGVARRWEISADGLTYTFYLREDALWSNGEPVTAGDFVAGIRRSASEASAYSFLLSPINNYQAVASGELLPSELGIRAVGDHELSFQLANPAPQFLGILSMPIALPLYSAGEFNARRFTDPQFFVGNGPYVLEERRLLGRIRLQRNANFHDAGSVNIEYVDFFPIDDPHTELNMYRAGELDITATVPPTMLKLLQESRPQELRVAPSLALYYLAFDLSEPPMNEAKLRMALSMSIDRQDLVSLLGRGEQAAFGVVPPGVTGHVSANYPWGMMEVTEREALARRSYAEAGYGADNPLSITLTYDVGDIHEIVALAVADMWRKVLGMEVKLDKREWKYFLATRERRDEWQIMRFAWSGDYNDATTFMDIFLSDSPQNLSGYANDSFDQLLDDARSLLDPGEREQKMTEAEQRLLDDYPIAPLYFFVSKHLVSARVSGFESNVLDRHPSRYLTIER